MNASVTSVIQWASRRTQSTSSCLGSDLSLWNVHKPLGLWSRSSGVVKVLYGYGW